MNNDLFAYATRNKLRFPSTKGELSTEQLWDVPLRSRDGFDLDTIAKNVNKAFKDMTEESFVSKGRTAAHKMAEIRLEVVKSIIATKLVEEDEARKRADNKAEKARLLQALAEKQQGALSAMTEEDLKRQIAALET